MIFDGKELHYVEPQSGTSLDDAHLLMKHSDLTANFTCGKYFIYIPVHLTALTGSFD